LASVYTSGVGKTGKPGVGNGTQHDGVCVAVLILAAGLHRKCVLCE